MKRLSKRVLATVLMLVLVLALPFAAQAGGCSNNGEHQWSQWFTEFSATCEWPGEQYRYCEICKTNERREYPAALGHNFQFVVREQPTCTKAGYGIDTCTRCGVNKDNGRPIPALGHNYERSVAQQPTCTSDGMAIYRCTRCGDSYREPIPATGHKWGAWQQGEAATCVKYGNRYHDCSRCGAREWERDYASGLGDHDWGEWVTVKEPTATEDGLKERTCKVDASHKEQEVIPATGELAEEAKPALELYMDLWVPALGVWEESGGTTGWKPAPDKEAITFEDEIYLDSYSVVNTGNVPLLCKTVITTGSNVEILNTIEYRKSFSRSLNPGENWAKGQIVSWHYASEEAMIPDPEDSPYAGTYKETWIVYGYALDDTEYTTPICKSNAYTFECKIAKQEDKKPGLTIHWEYDAIQPNGDSTKEITTTEPGVLGPKDDVWALYTFTNTGNIPLYVVSYATYGDGTTLSNPSFPGTFEPVFRVLPGETSGSLYDNTVWGSVPVTDHMTPGTETEDLLGTTTVSFYCVGYSLVTGEELCKSNEITRTWKVGKNVEPEDLGDSQLKVYTFWNPWAKPSDPAGYQLGEHWAASANIRNIGTVAIDHFTLRIDYIADNKDSSFYSTIGSGSRTDGLSWHERDYEDYQLELEGIYGVGLPAHYGNIQPEDVERGYIQVTATVKWIDPDSGIERTATDTSSMPVISKTGLLLNKGVENEPTDGYFKEGDQIEWTLSMKNNSTEPIKDITVTDKGATIGMFAEFTPEQGEIKLGVPKYTVTEYDAKVTGKVINYAVAKGTDLKGVEHTYTSNTATAKTKADTPEPFEPGGGGDPLGPVYDVHPAVSIIKAEAHKAASGDWYALDEMIDYSITVKNTGDTPLTNVQVYDSLGGFVPIGSCASLAVNEEKTFTFSWKTTAYDVDVTGYVVNQATVTYDFLGSIHGTPMTSNKVYVKAGENGFIPIIDGDGEDHFDPEILHTAGDSCCALTLNYAGDGTAYYTVTLCAEHQKVLDEAKAAADTGDWAKAAELIRTALDEFYGIYYEAADEEAKAAVINERLAFYAHIGAYQTLVGDRAAAEKLMLKLVQMCCMANTAQETLPDSLVNAMTSFGMTGTEVKAGRYIGLFDGTDEVTEGYEGPDARALNDVLDLLREAKSYDFNDVFERGQILWQASLDESVNAIYKAAEREQRKLIAAWRISLDTLYHGERPFLELLYPANDAVAEEVLMNLYKDTAMDKEQIR